VSLFKKFLKRITGDDAALRTFIQKAAGYSLTGVTSEQVLFFVHGKSGNNGKSTLINLIRSMLGDYGCHTPTETLLTKQYDNNIPADLARLAGARMVTAIEANFNRHLDEAKIKAMTGGEPITARFMRQNFFSFQPEFKLWFVANDRPRVRGAAQQRDALAAFHGAHLPWQLAQQLLRNADDVIFTVIFAR
jgi:putative DNA primase/helicase